MLERKIRKILKNNNINFIEQYKDERCRNKNLLRFDFAIFKNGKLEYLLECQRKQHYFPVKHFGGEEIFKKVVKRDNIKRKFCKENNIPLLEIKYDEQINKNKILNLVK